VYGIPIETENTANCSPILLYAKPFQHGYKPRNLTHHDPIACKGRVRGRGPVRAETEKPKPKEVEEEKKLTLWGGGASPRYSISNLLYFIHYY